MGLHELHVKGSFNSYLLSTNGAAKLPTPIDPICASGACPAKRPHGPPSLNDPYVVDFDAYEYPIRMLRGEFALGHPNPARNPVVHCSITTAPRNGSSWILAMTTTSRDMLNGPFRSSCSLMNSRPLSTHSTAGAPRSSVPNASPRATPMAYGKDDGQAGAAARSPAVPDRASVEPP